MKPIKQILRWFSYVTGLLLLLLIILNFIPVPQKECTSETKQTVYLFSNGYHTGIRLAKNHTWYSWQPHFQDYRGEWLEFGWGERDYYMADEPSIWLGVKAVLLPNKAVMNVRSFSAEKAASAGNGRIRKFELCEPQYKALCTYIQQSFTLNENGGIIPLQHHFYKAEGTYNALYNCNNWVNQALKQSGSRTPVWGSTSYTIFRMLPE